MATRSILLAIGGGVAAYKSLELIRLLRKADVRVTVAMTRAAAQFVTPLSAGALSEGKVYQDLFDLTDEAEMGHIQLSRAADLVVVAPATADLLAKMAHGHADDLVSTLLMATDKRVLVAPAMNVRMWEHAATRRNMATLRADGIAVVGPDEGSMACGEYGPGRMAEPEAIRDAALALLAPAARPLAGMRALVTSGPTHEPIDPVRYIANRSSGKQGGAIAAALAGLGADVTLVTGPTQQPDPPGARVVRVETARQMLAAVEAALPAEVAVFCAAVADWRAADEAQTKMKKDGSGAPAPLRLVENPDILATVAALPPGRRPALVVGFAAETDDVAANAAAKRLRKGCDWIVANDVSAAGGGVMGGDDNAVIVTDAHGAETWPRLSKIETARRLADRIAAHLAAHVAAAE